MNYKVAGLSKKSLIPAGSIAEILDITDLSQIINIGDFNRGFFEVVKETEVKETEVKIKEKASPKRKKSKVEDSLEKVEKEVRNYTDKE